MVARWKKKTGLLLSLACGLFLVIILSTAIGSVNIPPSEVGNALLSKIPGLNALAGPVPATYETIIFEIRLPRVILGVLVGAGLAVSGVALQGLFKNPMADPYVIGVSSGAALGATVAILAPVGLGLARMSLITLMAFSGGLGAVFIVYTISRGRGKLSVETLLLAGIAVAAFLSAITMFLMISAGEDLHRVLFWLMGGLSATGWTQVKIALPCVVVGALILCLFARELNVMLLGEEPAQHLGIEVETMKKIILVTSTFMAAAVVSVSGIIGFVGLVVPHMMRVSVGPDHRILIPASVLSGGIILVFSDTVARTVFSPQELPVGVITALFGAPFFLYLLMERKRTVTQVIA